MGLKLETSRLLLREVLEEDVEGFFELDSNPNVHRYLGQKPVTSIEECLHVIRFLQQQYKDYGIGRWAVIEKESLKFVGWAGLKYLTEAVNGHYHVYDLGYRLIENYWGKGYATEASKAILEYGFNTLRLDEIFACADKENKASTAVLEKAGFNCVGQFLYEKTLHNWYVIKNPCK